MSERQLYRREYIVWKAMRKRCKNPNDKDYPNYGGRGIGVCRDWDSFSVFMADMGKAPTPKHTIDRKDNTKDYCPSNCVWATRKEQANNRRSNRMIEYVGRVKSIAEWSDITGLSQATIKARLDRFGWSVEKTLTTKVKKRKKKRK